MEKYLVATYDKLSHRILVPKGWPVRGFKKLLLSFAEKVIYNDDPDQIVILRINNVPTMLVQREYESETYYVFETIFDYGPKDAHIINVVFTDLAMIKNPVGAGVITSKSSAGTIDENSNNEIQVDDYVVCKEQSYNKTTHYVVPVTQVIQWMRREADIIHTVDSHALADLSRYLLFTFYDEPVWNRFCVA
ncbi:uncharacterized protein LOC130674177 [Microplitis mediator]|uniref:uncharacterized protein LOC130674177 n=1 Tax=Microplitis mediator TaxID=375433 RepID=UPI0025543AE2|nr:uncharacterized protein LOC130674177 [Microplitis mediator]